jgi:hypothetical protein
MHGVMVTRILSILETGNWKRKPNCTVTVTVTVQFQLKLRIELK